MKATIWTMPRCSGCDHARAAVAALGYEIQERSGTALQSGDEPHVDALAQLAAQDMAYPVILLEDRGFVEPTDL